MNAWDELTASALIGTERRTPALPQLDGAVGQILRQSTSNGPEEALLRSAAVVALWQRAGRTLPAASATLPEPCPPDTRLRCNRTATAHLEMILSGSYRDALPEWLSLAAEAGLRAPDRLLPPLLDAGCQRRELRGRIAAVAGERGRWLAARNPPWAYVTHLEERDADTWETGHHAARVAFLRRRRAEDPEAARTLLEGSWKTEAGERRAELVEALGIGLSLADEPFLESVLSDRRKEARLAALDLLARLPEAGLVRRMSERVFARIRVRRVLLSESLEVALPDGLDEGMLRDGIEVKPPAGSGRMGDKASWLAQMIGLVPPQTWQARLGKRPGDLVRLACKGEWSTPLLEGWRQATLRHRNADWAEAILLEQSNEAVDTPELVNVLPPSRLLRLLEQVQRDGGEPRVLSALQPYHGAWDEALSRFTLLVLKRHLTSAKRDYALPQFMQRLGYVLTPLAPMETDEGWPVDTKEWRYWQDGVDRLQATLRFRREMRLALTAKDV